MIVLALGCFIFLLFLLTISLDKKFKKPEPRIMKNGFKSVNKL